MLTPQQVQFLNSAALAAVACEKTTGVPAALTVAQAVFESGWGSHCPGCNCFGIKANGRGCGTQLQSTSEFVNGQWTHPVLEFECYASLADCFTDHGWLISRGAPYAQVWKQFQEDHNYPQFVLGLAKIYATDPGYGGTILSFSTSTTVSNAIAAARKAAG